jgi:uncharacterized protein with HEPN domain
MINRDYCDYIQDMLDAIEKIQLKTKNITQQGLEEDDTLNLAIERLFGIIGEAANRIPITIQEKYSSIPWSNIVGMRNIIVHAYDKVETNIIWNAIQLKLPELKEKLTKMLTELDNEKFE